MFKNHFAHCLVAIVAAVGLLLVLGVEGGSLFYVLPLLICPLMMGFMMWMMMRGVSHGGSHSPDDQQSGRGATETTARTR